MVKLSSPISYRVVKYLLGHPTTTQDRISVEVGASIGLVNRVMRPLFEKGICHRGKRNSIKDVDALRLLEQLSWERGLLSLVRSTIRLQVSEVLEAEREIHNVCKAHRIDYALTTFTALNHYRPYYITYPTIHAYASEIYRLKNFLPAGRGAIAVELLMPDLDIIMKDVVVVGDLRLVSPIQTIIDLFCFGEGGRDGAMKLLDQIKNGDAKALNGETRTS